MQASFHRLVQADLNGILTKYYEISDRLAEELFAEFQRCIQNACANPKSFHFDASGLRRCNFDRFPYHFLYDVSGEHIRIWVLRHNRRNPSLGTRRFPR